MTQHTALTADRQNPTQHPLGVTSTPLDRDGRRGPSAWWFGLLALLPIACCGLPLLFVAGVTAGSGALLGGVTGDVLMLAGAVVLGIWEMRGHARGTRPTYTSTQRLRP